MRNVLYTGHLELQKWNISIRKAKHEAIISMDIYNKIQDKLQNISKKERKIESNLARVDISNDFPLR